MAELTHEQLLADARANLRESRRLLDGLRISQSSMFRSIERARVYAGHTFGLVRKTNEVIDRRRPWPPKGYRLHHWTKNGILYMSLELQEDRLDVIVGYQNELTAILRSTGITKLLAENHGPVNFRHTKHSVAASFFKNAVDPSLRIAVIDRAMNDPQHFGQGVSAAKNAGLSIRAFSSVPPAEVWLHSDLD